MAEETKPRGQDRGQQQQGADQPTAPPPQRSPAVQQLLERHLERSQVALGEILSGLGGLQRHLSTSGQGGSDIERRIHELAEKARGAMGP